MNELESLKIGKILKQVDLSKYTTYKIKETADFLAIPDDLDSFLELLRFIKQKKIKYKIIGGGSNLIFHGNYHGVLIKLENLNHCRINGTKVIVGAGYPLIKLATKVSKMGLTGMEFATGIPGTVGGAVFNNAGAYKSDMGYIVKEIKVLTNENKIIVLKNNQLDFHYRTSFLKEHPEYICLEATIQLKKGNKEEMLEIIKDRKKRRIESQPLDYPSAGSVFRNPKDLYAGKLIENIGYKGKMIGGAKVSEKHANFIINYNEASSDDIINLIKEIKEKIKEEYNIDLILEQEIVEG